MGLSLHFFQEEVAAEELVIFLKGGGVHARLALKRIWSSLGGGGGGSGNNKMNIHRSNNKRGLMKE